MRAGSGRPAVIHLVDDEPMVTGTLSAFLELETDYEIHTFAGGREALEALGAAPPDVVVSDFLMPGLNGLEYLAEVRKHDPEIVRILLTGYADKENAIRAINEVDLYQYLEKPLDNDQLLVVLANAVRHRSLRAALSDKIRELDRSLRHRDELEARDRDLQRELDWARTVQRRFLPEETPDPAGLRLEIVYEPAMAVGGDFYDFIPLAAGRLGLVVADSAGHGVQAALGTALLKFATGRLAGADVDAGGIMASMNEVLFQGLPRDIPVAACAAVLEPGSGRIRLVGGGLPAPLLLSAAGEVRELAVTGLLLGLVDGQMYTPGTEAVVDLAPGDTLLLMSDGVTEAQDAGDAFYGEGPLAADLSVLAGDAAPARALADRALAFGLPEHRDDLTILAIGHTGGTDRDPHEETP